MSEPSPSPVAHAGPDHLAETLDGPPGEARSGPIALGPERRLGRYTVLDVLGRGGMGVVYAAYDSQLDRRVALKVIRSPDSRRAPRHRQRLLREAQAMARLAHPNVIGVHDVGTLEDEVFLAMEFVAGSTLGEWARDAPRSWRDIRDAYLGAGRGLAAAHAAGLVHRDFKPDNVLIDDSRRARVTDFGLARADDSQLAAARDPSASDPELALDRDDGVTDSISGGSPLALRMTKVGTRIGTPAYMAPEQHAGEEADALSDQFSFCVALYEAFFDRAPFRGGTPESLAAHVLAGRVRSPPSGSPVPGPIRRAVMRGLSVRPEHRFATMGALLDALAYDPARRRRRVIADAGVAVLTTAAAVAGAAATEVGDPCVGAGGELLFDDERRAALAAAFEATGRSTANAVWSRADQRLTAYADRIAAVARESCRSNERGDRDRQTLARQTTCLDGIRDEFDAQLTVFEDVDLAMLDRTAETIGRLRRPEDCAQLERLQRLQAMPDDPDVRTAIATARGDLAHARALIEAGRYAAGIEAATAVAERARELDWAPLTADALIQLGNGRGFGEALEVALPALNEAIAAAAESGDSRRLVHAWLTKARHMSHGAGLQRDTLAVLDVLESLSRWGQSGASDRAQLAAIRGGTLMLMGRIDDARAVYEALMADEALVAHAPRSMAANYAATLLHAGDYETARAVMLEAMESDLALVGAEHPSRVAAAANVAITYARQGEYDEALRYADEALALVDKLGGPPPPVIAVVHLTQAEAALARRQRASAEAYLADADAVARRYEPDGGRLRDTIELERGRVLELQGDHEGAAEILLRVRGRFVETYGDPSAEVAHVDAELAEVRAATGDRDEAIRLLEGAVKSLGVVQGDDHPVLAAPRAQLGVKLAARGDRAPAQQALRHALDSFEAVGGDPATFARAYAALARLSGDPDSKAAQQLATHARTEFVRAGPAFTDELALLDAWLEK